MEKIITRFAPSPTGRLHIGNVRIAIINWLYARKVNGLCVLRFDDTDLERSTQEHKDAIANDLKFLGLYWDQTFAQSTRLGKYESIKNTLLQNNKLYPCFETKEELEMKRKLQLSRSLPPIYDRASLQLTKKQINDYIKQGRKPHYRFLVDYVPIIWQDIIKGTVSYEGKNLSDPIVIREDDSMTYMLCSVIDDIDYAITHIIRGDDHLTNTAMQVQMFAALGKEPPNFAHLSLIINHDEKISKRKGGFDLTSLQTKMGLEPMAINSFFTFLGSSKPIVPCKTLDELVKKFDIINFSRSPTIYQPQELQRLNHKLLITLSFDEVKERLKLIGASAINAQFWLAVRPNLQKLDDIKDWWNICYHHAKVDFIDREFLQQAANLLPHAPLTLDSWSQWTGKIAEITGKKGKDLFMPLRLAITGMSSGPEMSNMLPLISREEIIKRLSGD